MDSRERPRNRRRDGIAGPDIRTRRAGFTLIELIVSMSILLLLAAMTFTLLNITLDSDRIRTGSRELQSFLAGARDRAIYAGALRGVRFIPDQNDPLTIRSFAYIGAPSDYTDGSLIYFDTTTNPNGNVVFVGTTTLAAWQNLWTRGSFANGIQIQLFNGTTNLYANTILTVSGNPLATGTSPPTGFALTKNPLGLPTSAATAVSYTLKLGPSLLADEQPRTLPDRVAIDLRTSVLPASWGTNSPTFDLLFNPGGTVFGASASDGRIHFVLADTADTFGTAQTQGLPARYQLNAGWQSNFNYGLGNVIVPVTDSFVALRCTGAGQSGGTPPTWPTLANATVMDGGVTWQSFIKKQNLIVSVATSSGRVTTHPVSFTLIPAAGTPPPPPPWVDTFQYAETGEVTQ